MIFFESTSHFINLLEFSIDGQWLLTGGVTGELCVWSIHDRQKRRIRNFYQGGSSWARYGPNPDTIFMANHNKLEIVNFETNMIETYPIAREADRLTIAACSPDRKIVLVYAQRDNSGPGELIEWLFDERCVVARIPYSSSQAPQSACFGAGAICLQCRDGKIRIGSTENELDSWDVFTDTQAYWISSSQDGRLLGGVYRNSGFIWDLSNRQLNGRFRFGLKHLKQIAFHPRGYLAMTASHYSRIVLLDTATCTSIREFSWHDDLIQSLEFSPDGSLAACASKEGTIVVWDIES